LRGAEEARTCGTEVPGGVFEERASIRQKHPNMHLKSVRLYPERYPVQDRYPFDQNILRHTPEIVFRSPVTVFAGENGTGKSTLLEAISHKCGIHIWAEQLTLRLESNPYENTLHRYLEVEWANGKVPGSFFGAGIFRQFVRLLDEWARTDPGQLDYFGGKSLVTQSHGQSLLSFFRSRYRVRGLYLLDEPETALSPRSQLELLHILRAMSAAGHAQFIVATHSPLLMACPGCTILSFDRDSVEPVEYEETDYFKIYRDFLLDREKYLDPA
jgi:predicted ATPase